MITTEIDGKKRKRVAGTTKETNKQQDKMLVFSFCLCV